VNYQSTEKNTRVYCNLVDKTVIAFMGGFGQLSEFKKVWIINPLLIDNSILVINCVNSEP